MRRAGRGLLRATIASIVAVAVGPVGIAMAIPPTVTIESPVNESVTNPTPSFSGTGEFKTLVSPLVETCSAEPSIEGQPKGQTVVEPAGATFTVTEGTIPSGCSAATIQWQVSTNGGPWNNVSGSNVTATSATLSINSTSTSESGNKYRAELTNLASPSYSNAATLTVNPAPPTVASIEPSSGTTVGGTSVKIKGSGFVSGATVKIGNEATSVKLVTATEITATTVATAAGSDEVIVSDANGASTLGPPYTYIPPPTVTSITPSPGPRTG